MRIAEQNNMYEQVVTFFERLTIGQNVNKNVPCSKPLIDHKHSEVSKKINM